MDINSLILNEKDNVAVAIKTLKSGDVARFILDENTMEVIVVGNISRYHKFSLCEIKNGCKVFKYGQEIGIALADIGLGEHVHSHNLASLRQKMTDNELRST